MPERRKWHWKDYALLFVSLGGMSALGIAWKLALLPTQLQAADKEQMRLIKDIQDWRVKVQEYMDKNQRDMDVLITRQQMMLADVAEFKHLLLSQRK